MRSVRSPLCRPYYANEEDVTLKTGIPALWMARCTPSLVASDYFIYEADFFRLRAVTLSAPLDIVMPDRISSSQLTLALNNFIGQYDTQWNNMMATSTVAALPIILIFASLQRFIVGGLTSGAVKE